MAKFMDISRKRFYQLMPEGVCPQVARGRYDALQTNISYIRYLRDRTPLKGQQPFTFEA